MDTVRLDWFERWSEYQPDKIAIVDSSNGAQINYSDLNRLASKTATFLSSIESTQSFRLAFLGEFSIQFTILFAAAQKHRFCLVPLNYRLSSNELLYSIQHCEPLILIYDSKYRDTVQVVAQNIPSLQLFTIDELMKILYSFSDNNISATIPQLHDPIFLLYTSGTTGKPKGVPYTHQMLLWNSIDTAWRLDLIHTDKTLMCLPPFHTGGLNVLYSPVLHRGGTVILQPKFQADEALLLLRNHSCTIFMAIPTIVKMMAASPLFKEVSVTNIRYMIVGGEALPLYLIEQWQEKGIKIRQGYGLTEAGPSITSLHEDDCIRKRGSIGKVNFYVQAKWVDASGNQVPVGKLGELWLKGPSVMKEYWNNPDANELHFSDGWYKTGDMVLSDDEGYLYMVDRIKNMYKSGGENIYPAEIERILLDHPDIIEAVVLGIKDETWGEVGIAFLVLRERASLSEEEVRQFLEKKIAKFKIPKKFRFIKSVPLNDSGKADRKVLLNL